MKHLPESLTSSKVSRLVDHPDLGLSGRVAGTRELVAQQNYILIYATTADWVRILRVLHAAKQWPPVRT